MSDQIIVPNKYSELISNYKNYIDTFTALYQLKTENKEELNSIFKLIKTNLIDSKIYLPQNIVKTILDIIPFNNRYTKSYLDLVKIISEDYHIEELTNIPNFYVFLIYKGYGSDYESSKDLEKMNIKISNIHAENTIYRAIMDDDIERFIAFTVRDGFNKDQVLNSNLFPPSAVTKYSLLELCCYYRSVRFFKLLRTKFNSEITPTCLKFSFLGGNPEIMSECLKC
ncbi:hypothetical protein TVAG_370530 [Trichomonas vaginalis G3]|uniref:DUF3447 domain-containing protein n=1 Tax=Trichomonas vaginalis (strain ATCC PRA-98 / G3) TaxID=412133 RepID=A2FJQ0_TRIV3|nr:protein of unknown function (DUF3447) [Trichomonas vaginalis G3]EAX94882.1 hypothetical protein TVAG_370530 [Trichomonas vaginalis G3]KAI5541494.1 protein of unknown function (DUF3447) [Trichomonas vaginalis G3]|eukprot:XP_001307812.1 hypothetical protein [Trichomonas vaginalis G3]